MAFTLSFALLGSLVLSMTLVPTLSSWFVKGQHGETRAVRWMRGVFVPALDWVLAHARQTLLGALALLLGALLVGSQLGTEFLPALDEGNVWLRVTMPVGISLEQAKLVERRIRSIVLVYPQLPQVLTQPAP